MTKSLLTAITLVAALPAGMALAQDALDTSGDGMVSVEEIQAVYPEVSTDIFLEIDVDGDGLLSAEELAAARDAGLVPEEAS
ncbi:EF-hand domain-containing protein [Primorskyibacter sp. 2E233]|uniref:EF-hand domain-containing protein n=1 Tax=Primorskyibacter sp. 2E233 TaxID=3413431 RepID=UPI003BF294F6